jgi:hypothetical protein
MSFASADSAMPAWCRGLLDEVRAGGLGPGLRRDDGCGGGGVHQGRANPRIPRLAYDAAAPLTEGCSMEAYQVVRAGLQLGRGYATVAAGLRVAAQGETPGAQ